MESPEGPPPPGTGGGPSGGPPPGKKASPDSNAQQELLDLFGGDMWPSAMIAVLLLLNLLRGEHLCALGVLSCPVSCITQ